MMSFCRRSFLALVLAGAALLIMGANGKMISKVTSSVTGSITSATTTSVISRTTGSVSSKMTGSTANSVKSSLTSSVTTSVISKGTGTPVTLSPYAEELAKIIKFDRQVLIIVKEMTQEHIRRLIGYDEDDYQIVAAGIAVPVPEGKTEQILAALRKKLMPLHYLPFIVEKNPGLKIDKIGVIKGTDPYEIIRIMHTDDGENDISNQDVIDRLKEWGKISSFDIIGASSDWVEIEFKTLPKDLKSFANEVYDFSPEAVNQGPGTVEKLIKEIKKTNRLILIWE